MGNINPKIPKIIPAMASPLEPSPLVIPIPPKIIPRMDKINAGIIKYGLGNCIALNATKYILIIPKTKDKIPKIFFLFDI